MLMFFSLCLVPTSPPLDISVSSIISTAVLVCWTPPTQPNGIITHYTLRIDYNGAIATETVGGIHSLYFIDQLSPDQLVGVSMSAATVSGSGPWSSFVFNQTGGMLNLATSWIIFTITAVILKWLLPFLINIVCFRNDCAFFSKILAS